METTPRTPSASITERSTPVEATITAAELSLAAGITPAALERLVRLGFVAPSGPGQFEAAAALRLTRMLRLRRDLGIGLTSATIIVELLERLESLGARQSRTGGGG